MADTTRALDLSSYRLTEDEYFDLMSLRDQLGMFNTLLAMRGAGSDSMECTADQLEAFTLQLERIADKLVEAAKARSDASRGADLPTNLDLACALRFLAGRPHLGAPFVTRWMLQRVTKSLRNAARVEPDMQSVCDAWTDAVTQGGHGWQLDSVLNDGDPRDALTREQIAAAIDDNCPAVRRARAAVPAAAAAPAEPVTAPAAAQAATHPAGDTLAISETTLEQMLATASGSDDSAQTVLAVMEALSDGPHEQRRQRVLAAYLKALEARGLAVPELVVNLQQGRAATGRPAPVAAAAAHDERVASVLAGRARQRRTPKAVATAA